MFPRVLIKEEKTSRAAYNMMSRKISKLRQWLQVVTVVGKLKIITRIKECNKKELILLKFKTEEA